MAPVLVPVTFPDGQMYQAIVRQFIGVGTLNVKTARGEVKAESTDIIMTFEDDPDDPENQDNLDDIRAGKTSVVFPLDFFVALFPDAEITTKMQGADRVIFDALGEALFIDAEGKWTDYEGNVVEPTDENKARWPGAFQPFPVVNGPRKRSWPFADHTDEPAQLPSDQGALNRLLIDKIMPPPEVDKTSPTPEPPRAEPKDQLFT